MAVEATDFLFHFAFPQEFFELSLGEPIDEGAHRVDEHRTPRDDVENGENAQAGRQFMDFSVAHPEDGDDHHIERVDR